MQQINAELEFKKQKSGRYYNSLYVCETRADTPNTENLAKADSVN